MADNELRDDFMFARIGGKTYTLTETRLDTLQGTIDAIKQAANSRIATLSRTLNRDTWQAANACVTDEHNRIIRESQATRVTIPENMTCVPVVAINGTLCPVRSYILAPNKVDCSLHGLIQYAQPVFKRNINEIYGSEVFTPERTSRSTAWRIIVKFSKVPLSIPSMVAKYGENIVRTHYSFHDLGAIAFSNGVQWQRMCIGNSTSEQYWALPRQAFNEQLNSINLDSLGGAHVQPVPFTGITATDRNNTHSISIYDWLNTSTIESVSLTPASEEWRAGR
jgi:hypothetical protein